MKTASLFLLLTLICLNRTRMLKAKKESKLRPRPIRSVNGMLTDDTNIHLGRFVDVLYKGKWNSSKQTQNGFIRTNYGTIIMVFGEYLGDRTKLMFEFIFYEGYYVEDRFMASLLTLNLQNDAQTVIEGSKEKGELYKMEHLFSDKGQDTCNLKTELRLYDSHGTPRNITTNDIGDLLIEGLVTSDNCDFNIDFNVGAVEIDLLNVSLFIIIQITALAFGFYPFYRSYRYDDLYEVNNISELTMLCNIVIDMMILVTNLSISMRVVPEYFEFLSIITMFLFMSLIFKMRTYTTVFESRIHAQNIDIDQLSRIKFHFFLKTMMVSILGICCAGFLIINYQWHFLLALYPLIQIFHNSFNVIRKNCFKFHLHVPFFICQFLYPISYRSLNFNFFQLRQNYNFGIILVSIILAQLIMMYLQKLFGPAFYLPKCLIPNYFQYHRKLKNLKNPEEENCPICFTNLSELPECDSSLERKLLPTKYMETPCRHKFHEKCLKSWMEQKLICPCCRMAIPPY